MRDPNRIDKALLHINRIWKRYPDMRFGQLVENLYTFYIFSSGEYLPKDYFYIEDDEFLLWLETFVEFK